MHQLHVFKYMYNLQIKTILQINISKVLMKRRRIENVVLFPVPCMFSIHFFTYKGKKKLEQVSVCMDPDVAAV